MAFFIKNLKCENTVNPIGIDTESPAFSWQFTSDINGVCQTAYTICIYDENKKEIYNSGKKESQEQFAVKANLKEKIKPFQKYFYSVTIWDDKGNFDSGDGFFVTGIFKTHQWKAEWFKIWYVFGGVGYTRKEFDILDEEIEYAYCFLGAVGEKVNSVSAFLNGERIGNNVIFPGATEYFRAFFSGFDVKYQLKKGKNTIGMLISKCASAIIKIKYKSGKEQFVLSKKGDWKFTEDGGYKIGHDLPLMYHGKAEYFDRTKHHEGFTENGFDDSNWGYYRDPFNQIDFGPLFISAQYCRAIIQKEIKPTNIMHFDDRIIIDFGLNFSGFAEFKLKGNRGEKIEIIYSERLTEDMHVVLPGSYPLCEYTFAGSNTEIYRPEFLVTGMNFIEIRGYNGKLTEEDVTAYFVHSEVLNETSFSCSDQSLNRLNAAARQSFVSNLVNIPTDCPERERRGWTGDAFAVSEAECVNYDLKNIYRQWFISYRDCSRGNGWVPVELPLCTDDCVDLNWPMACILIPYEILKHYNDLDFCRDNYSLMRGYANLLLELCDEEYVLSPRFYSYKDWQTKQGCTAEFLGMSYFYRAISCLAEIAEAIEKNEDSMFYKQTAENIKTSINKHFYKNGNFDNGTQSANSHALYFNICEEENKLLVAKNLADKIKSDGRNTTGFLGTSCILQALSQNKQQQAAYDLLKNPNKGGWLWLVDVFGATSFPEIYSGDCNSQNHAFLGSAPGLWLYKYLCGISPIEHGYKKIRVAPFIPKDISFANATISTNYGEIKVSLTKNEYLNAKIDIPFGTSAIFEYNGEIIELSSGHHELTV